MTTVSTKELKAIAQRAAGSSNISVYVDPERDADKVTGSVREILCKLGLPECRASKEELEQMLSGISSARAIPGASRCSIIMSLADTIKDIVRTISDTDRPESYGSIREENLPEALRYIMLHEGAHCRMRYSDEAISKLKLDGDESLLDQERSKQEQAAELSAILFTLKDAYRSNDPQRINSVRSRLLETSKYYTKIDRQDEQQFYTELPRLIRAMLDISPTKIKNLSESKIRSIVDNFYSNSSIAF